MRFVGISDLEGSIHAHDVIPVKTALKYLAARGYPESMGSDILLNIKAKSMSWDYKGSTKELGANRVVFGEAVNLVLDKLSKEEAAAKVMVIDSKHPDSHYMYIAKIVKSLTGDLEGSTGLKVIHQKHPEVYIPCGIMERGNFSAAAGFGFAPDKFGVFSTFSAFLEMVVSEITMARLNNCNVLCHFSHSGGACVSHIITSYLTLLFPSS